MATQISGYDNRRGCLRDTGEPASLDPESRGAGFSSQRSDLHPGHSTGYSIRIGLSGPRSEGTPMMHDTSLAMADYRFLSRPVDSPPSPTTDAHCVDCDEQKVWEGFLPGVGNLFVCPRYCNPPSA